eukprot:c20521_g1_i2.p1 GENE.c20521_g1_i2~~c20521_g1_i2.p1  ORF type:complete len:288 (+),score=18.31 c20521_g1_i2:532-1395(+)
MRPLDDAFAYPRSQHEADSILNLISGLPWSVRGGLVLNRRKCTFVSSEDILTVGCELLGSVIGGPDSESNPVAGPLLQSSVGRLRDRLQETGPLTLQERLLLLRYCFFPTFNHFLRSMHPDVTAGGSRAFDNVITDVVQEWFGSLPEHGSGLIRLPVRLGGLGLVSQEQIREVCYGASFVLSQGVLRERGMGLGVELLRQMDSCVTTCAVNLGLSASDLLAEPHCRVSKSAPSFASTSNAGRNCFTHSTGPVAPNLLRMLSALPGVGYTPCHPLLSIPSLIITSNTP